MGCYVESREAERAEERLEHSGTRIWRVTTNDGTLMEMNPRPVDIAVKRPIGESSTGRESQLDRAVEELLKQIDGGGSGNRK